MKQLTIYCSHDLEERVVTALDEAGVEGFVRLGHATANRFRGPGEVPRALTWEATMFLVPGVPEERADAVVRELSGYAGACDIAPCLRIVVSPVEAMH
jgi:hypothetical protein